MWHIVSPFKLYQDYFQVDNGALFSVFCILRSSKFYSFSSSDQNLIATHPDINLEDVSIRNPDNPAQLPGAKLISFTA
jgi:hypothetical protein